MSMMHDPFMRCTGIPKKEPELMKREERIIALGEWAAAVLAGADREPDVEFWLAQCFLAWLRGDGGMLTRDHLKTAAGQGCTQSESRVWQRLKEPSSGRQLIAKDPATMESSKSTYHKEDPQ
jgi:hypothetical protein